jgi:hypothetical protein
MQMHFGLRTAGYCSLTDRLPINCAKPGESGADIAIEALKKLITLDFSGYLYSYTVENAK